MNRPTAERRSAAASATAISRRGKSCSRLPLSPSPGAGSTLNSMSPIFHLERVREAAQYVHGSAQVPSTTLADVEGVEDATQLRRQQVGQRAPLGSLDLGRLESLVVCECAQSIEQHGLADPAQAQQHEPLGRTPGEHAIHVDGHIFDQPVATSQFRRLQAGTGSIWVVAAVHRISSVGREASCSI